MKTTMKRIITICAAMTMTLGMTVAGAHAFIQTDLDKVKSTGVCTNPCDLTSANLSGVTIRDLTGARVSNASLIGATIASGAKLGSTNFSSSKLNNVNLSGATMNGSTSFFGANLTGATPPTSGWGGANLTGATWTDGVKKCGAASYGVCK